MMERGYRKIAVLLMTAFLCACMFFVFGDTAFAKDEPKSEAVTTHEPQSYVAEYTKGASENSFVLEIRNEATGEKYDAWNDLPFLFPGDTVTIIPKLPSESEALRNNNTSYGVAGLVFPDKTAGNKYPILVTSIERYGNRIIPGSGCTFIQGFTIEGTGPVKLVSNGSYIPYTSETVETLTWTNDVRNVVTYNYGADWLDFKYYPAWNKTEYQYWAWDSGKDTVEGISEEDLIYYGDTEKPDAIWAVDAIYNLTHDEGKAVYTMSRPYAEGYSLKSMQILTQSKGYDRADYYFDEGNNTITIIPKWKDVDSSIPEGEDYSQISYEDEWTAIVFNFDYCVTLTLDANGGTIDGKKFKVYEFDGERYDEDAFEWEDDMGGKIDAPQWGDMAFTGWYLDKECTIPAGDLEDIYYGLSENSSEKEKRCCHVYAGWKKTGWVEQDGKKYYYRYDGTMEKGFLSWGPDTYFFDEETGEMRTGWVTVDDWSYYFGEDGVLLYSILFYDGKVYYYDAHGHRLNGLPESIGLPSDVPGLVEGSSGAPGSSEGASGASGSSGGSYDIPGSGKVIMTGWQTVDGKTYYFDSKGRKTVGWLNDGGKDYYFDLNGVMRTGWQKVSGKWYFLNKDGVMQTGWKKLGGKWYYLASNGVMQTGWKKIDGTWYYLKTSGEMASCEYHSGFWLNKNGSWTYKPRASWKKSAKGWWYGDTSGWYAKSATYCIDGVNYTFGNEGYYIEP